MSQPEKPLTIAVVGCGVAGLTAGWLLSRKHDVHFFEKNNYIGGHTRTLKIDSGPDAGLSVDTGFIVMNQRNYPLFTQVLNQLKVPTSPSSMTFSYFDQISKYGYSGNSLNSLFPNLNYLVNRTHLSLIKDLWRFARIGYADLQSGFLDGKTLGTYFKKRKFSQSFLNNYLYPMGAAIWSSPLAEMPQFPAQPYLHFLENHGLLRLTNRPQWQYVTGGSRTYIEAMLKTFTNQPKVSTAPKKIIRKDATNKIELHFPDGRVGIFDHVIIGTHADEALKLLEDPSEREQQLLSPWKYQPNTVILHSSSTHLPPNKKLWASWNFIRESGLHQKSPVSVSYYMNRLQDLQSTQDYIVTLNATSKIPEKTIINQTTLTHPLYSFASMSTQPKLRKMNGSRNTWFCGSYFGYGFHEDAVKSAVEIAEAFEISL